MPPLTRAEGRATEVSPLSSGPAGSPPRRIKGRAAALCRTRAVFLKRKARRASLGRVTARRRLPKEIGGGHAAEAAALRRSEGAGCRVRGLNPSQNAALRLRRARANRSSCERREAARSSASDLRRRTDDADRRRRARCSRWRKGSPDPNQSGRAQTQQGQALLRENSQRPARPKPAGRPKRGSSGAPPAMGGQRASARLRSSARADQNIGSRRGAQDSAHVVGREELQARRQGGSPQRQAAAHKRTSLSGPRRRTAQSDSLRLGKRPKPGRKIERQTKIL